MPATIKPKSDNTRSMLAGAGSIVMTSGLRWRSLAWLRKHQQTPYVAGGERGTTLFRD